MLLRPGRGGKEKPNIKLFAQGHCIPNVESVRGLGLRIQADGKNKEMIQALGGTAYQVAWLIPSISNRNYGMKKGILIRLVQAFLMCRQAYVVHFIRLSAAEKSKLERIQANDLPGSTPNEKLEALVVHNTITEAQRTAQLERLTRSATGRHILQSLGLRYETQTSEKVDVPLDVREILQISPIPKHRYPVHDVKRREAKAKALGITLKEFEGVLHVNAAEYQGSRATTAAVVNGDRRLVASCSVKTDNTETAEEVAVVLALSTPGVRTIVCDSQSTVRHFGRGRVSSESLRVLRGATGFGERERVRLVWTPAHASLPGNEGAHDAARGLTFRAGTTSAAPIASSGRDRLVTFRDILDHYTAGWARYSPAHPSLKKRQSTAWRRLQTTTHPSPDILNGCYPDRNTGTCEIWCGSVVI